jgi:hypothetical protein
MYKVLIVTVVFSISLSSAVLAADVSGSWTLKMKGFMGDDEEIEMVIKATGEKLKITVAESTLGEMSGNGRLKEDIIKFKLNAKGDMPMSFIFKGTVAGNKMSGTRTIDFMGGMGGPGPGSPDGFGGPPPGFGELTGMNQISKDWTAEKQ